MDELKELIAKWEAEKPYSPKQALEAEIEVKRKFKWQNLILLLFILLVLSILPMALIKTQKQDIAVVVNGESITLSEFNLRYRYSNFPMHPKDFFDQLVLEKAILSYIGKEPKVTSDEISKAIDFVKRQKNITDAEFSVALEQDNITIHDLEELYYNELLTDKINKAISDYVDRNVYSQNPLLQLNSTGQKEFEQRSKKELNDFLAKVKNSTTAVSYISFNENEIMLQNEPVSYVFP